LSLLREDAERLEAGFAEFDALGGDGDPTHQPIPGLVAIA